MNASFTTPDGSRVTLASPALGASGPWNCLFVAAVYGTRHALTVCQAGSSDRYAASMGSAGLTTRPYRDAQLAFGYSTRFEESIAAWRGAWHELLTTRSGPPADPGAFTRVLDAFHLGDTPDGLRIRPRRARHVAFEPPTVFTQIPGIGDLRIRRPHESDVVAPQWQGAQGRVGEVWRMPLTDGATGRARQESLVLATTSAVAELIPGPDDTPDSTAAARFLMELDVSWTTS